ncbi:MAG: SDR family oxidoreductase [Chloroflexi bacterium]|nr:SDR family oxidoreductase [Chloroflexota bacterium]
MPTFAPDALAGKVAIVTGGGTGIGRAIALEFAKVGADIVLASRKVENLEKVAAEVRGLGQKALVAQCDVRERAQVEAMTAAAVKEFKRIDVLVNNAAGNFNVPAEGLSQNGWNAVVRIVLDGTWNCSQAVGKEMIAAKKGGVIINITSNTPLTGSPGNVHSASAKGGVVAMAHTLALEWARHGIRVMCVAPGQTETEGVRQQLWQNPDSDRKYLQAIPAGRYAKPEEVAYACIFVASAAGAYLTGSTIYVDGGSTLVSVPASVRIHEARGDANG